MTADDLIRILDLAPLPIEGGFFRQTWVSVDETVHPLDGRHKPAGTAIFYLLTDAPDSFSALHRLPTDEVYHFYLGDPVEQLLLHPGGRVETVVLGSDVAGGQRPQWVAPRGVWQGSRLVAGGRLALLGTTMAPGFVPGDYEGGRRNELCAAYPEAADRIRALTRD